MIRYLCIENLQTDVGLFEKDHAYSMVHRDNERGTATLVRGLGTIIDIETLNHHFRLCTRKHNIEKGTEVVFLHHAQIARGVVTKVNSKSYRVDVPSHGFFKSFNGLIKKEKVAHIDDVCSIVCDYGKDPNGQSVRFDYDTYPAKNKKVTTWGQPANYIVEN